MVQNVDYTLHSIYSKLAPAREHLRNDPWAGIPELVCLTHNEKFRPGCLLLRIDERKWSLLP